jgi:malate dehydrogenase
MKTPIKVLITGAAGQICYSLVPMILSGQCFGMDQPLILHLLEVEPAEGALKGFCMEIDDSAFPLLHEYVPTVDPVKAFTDIDYAFFVGAFPRKQGMERKDLLDKNAEIFKSQGVFLNKYAKKTVKCLVVGNPANTNCYILAEIATSIPKENFSALTRLDHNRTISQVAKKLNIATTKIHDVIVWGNHSNTMYPDVSHGFIEDGTKKIPLKEAIKDEPWIQNEMLKKVQNRGAEIIAARKFSSATSAAKASVDHMRDWVFGTNGEIVSMAIPSDGSYGITKGIIYSYPVRIDKKGKVEIVQNLTIDEFSKTRMITTEKELLEEKKTVFPEK